MPHQQFVTITTRERILTKDLQESSHTLNIDHVPVTIKPPSDTRHEVNALRCATQRRYVTAGHSDRPWPGVQLLQISNAGGRITPSLRPGPHAHPSSHRTWNCTIVRLTVGGRTLAHCVRPQVAGQQLSLARSTLSAGLRDAVSIEALAPLAREDSITPDLRPLAC